MDAAMSLVTAVCELLVQCRWTGGEPVLHILPAGLPKGWRDLEFDGVLTEGAFLCGATVRDAAATQLRITSLRGEPLILATHGLEDWLMNGAPVRGEQGVLRVPTTAGQTVVIERPG
jgi:hypothetical protein